MSEPGNRIRILLGGALLLLALAAGIVLLGRREEVRPLVITTPAPSPAAPTTGPALKVYVSGAVLAPGVYDMRGGERVDDALRRAGGSLPDAELAGLNLAAKVRDEQHIHVPRQGERPSSTSAGPAGGSGAGPGKLDLNAASFAELDALPYVGRATAEKILAYRQAKGRFQAVNELLEAKLVNQRAFDAIKDLVVVSP